MSNLLNALALTKEAQIESITIKLNSIVKSIGTVQGNIHELLIESTLFTFKYKGEGVDVVSKILNNLTGVRGSFRVESVAYWYRQIAGIDCTFNSKTDRYDCRLANDRYLSEQGITFTYDKAHLALCKLDSNRFWKVAPVIIKDLKMPSDVEKTTNSAEIMLARALAGGSLSEVEIQAHLVNMLDRIKLLATGSKTKEWLDTYYLQNPQERPVTIDQSDAEIAELLEEERIAELEAS